VQLLYAIHWVDSFKRVDNLTCYRKRAVILQRWSLYCCVFVFRLAFVWAENCHSDDDCIVTVCAANRTMSCYDKVCTCTSKYSALVFTWLSVIMNQSRKTKRYYSVYML